MKFLKNKINRIGQEVWEHKGRKVSIVSLGSNFKRGPVAKALKNHPELRKMFKRVAKMCYGEYIWEWIELPTNESGGWGDPKRYKTKEKARKAAKEYLREQNAKK